MMPLFQVNGNELTSLKGEVSSFFEIKPPDMEGFDEKSQEQIFIELENDVINTDGLVKLYWLNQKLYLNCFSDVALSHGEVLAQEKPIATFLGRDDARIHFYDNYLTCGTEFIRVLSLKDYPASLDRFEVNNWPDFVLTFKKIPKLEAKSKINFKRKLHFSALFKGMRDLDSENAYYQAENLFDDVTTDNKALFKAEIFFLLKSSTKEQLDKLTEKMIYEFKGKGAELFVEERGLSYLFQQLVPGVPANFKRSVEVPSDYLSYLVPFHRDFAMGEGLELKSRSGQSVFFDLFNQQALNYNVLITGSSGQGKSMMAGKLLKYELEEGSKAMVLDLGNSFAKNAKFHDGVILSQRFNPLQFRNTRYLKEFVLAAIEEKLPKKEEGRLFEVIESILHDQSIKSFSGFLAELENEFSGMRFYFKEIEDYFTDEILPLNDFTYCDFGLYPEAMKAPLIIYLIEYFKNLNGKKVFIFDECWHLLLKNADYIAECFRTFRKHQASAVAISQNLDDFSESQLGRVIIQNTYFKFLFKQSLNASEFLDPHAKNLLDSIHSKKGEYSEFLLLTEEIKKPVRFHPTSLEYHLFTSDRKDNNQFEYYLSEKGRFIPFKEAIENFTRIKNPMWEAYEEVH